MPEAKTPFLATLGVGLIVATANALVVLGRAIKKSAAF